jgi:hypothetical protein
MPGLRRPGCQRGQRRPYGVILRTSRAPNPTFAGLDLPGEGECRADLGEQRWPGDVASLGVVNSDFREGPPPKVATHDRDSEEHEGNTAQ